MSRFSKAVHSVVSHPLSTVAAPVLGVTQAVTGLSPQQQLAMGAGIGGTMSMLGGAPGSAGPVSSGGGVASASGISSLLSNPDFDASLISGAASMYGASQMAEAQRRANNQNVDIAREQMSFSAGQAQREMDFQERMSGSSYQRAVADMRAAGINPMMASGNGGASTPGGAMGSSAGADIKPIPSVVANSLSSASDLLRTYADVKKSFADADHARASADLARTNIPKSQAETENIKAHTVPAQFESRLFSVINGMFDRVKGAWDSTAKGQRILPFMKKGESGSIEPDWSLDAQ